MERDGPCGRVGHRVGEQNSLDLPFPKAAAVHIPEQIDEAVDQNRRGGHGLWRYFWFVVLVPVGPAAESVYRVGLCGTTGTHKARQSRTRGQKCVKIGWKRHDIELKEN